MSIVLLFVVIGVDGERATTRNGRPCDGTWWVTLEFAWRQDQFVNQDSACECRSREITGIKRKDMGR